MVEIGNYKSVSSTEVVGDNGVTFQLYSRDFIHLTRAEQSFWLVREGRFGPQPDDIGDIIYLDTAHLAVEQPGSRRALTKEERAFWKPNIEAIYRAQNLWCLVQTSDPCPTVTTPGSITKSSS